MSDDEEKSETTDTETSEKNEKKTKYTIASAAEEAIARLTNIRGSILSATDSIARINDVFAKDPKLLKLIAEASKIHIPTAALTSSFVSDIQKISEPPMILPPVRKAESQILNTLKDTVEYMKTVIKNQNAQSEELKTHTKNLEDQLETLKQIDKKTISKKTAFIISLGASVVGLIIGLVLGY